MKDVKILSSCEGMRAPQLAHKRLQFLLGGVCVCMGGVIMPEVLK